MKINARFDKGMTILVIIYTSTCLSQFINNYISFNYIYKFLRIIIVMYYLALMLANGNRKKWRFYRPGKFETLWILFFIYLLISAVFTATDIINTFTQVFYLLLTIYIAHRIYFKYQENFILIYFQTCFVIQVFQLAFIRLFPQFSITINGEVNGSFGQKNNLAIFMVITAMFAFQLFMHKSSYRLKFYTIISILLSVFFIVKAQSATSLIILVIASTTYILYNRLKSWINITIICTAVTVLFLPMYSIITTKFESIFLMLGRSSDFTGRVLIWKRVFDLWKQKLLFGYGYNSFWSDNPIMAQSAYGLGSHNGLLELLISIGLIGTVFFFVLIIIWGDKIKVQDKGIWCSLSCMYIIILTIYMLGERSLSALHYQTLLLAVFIISTLSPKYSNIK